MARDWFYTLVCLDSNNKVHSDDYEDYFDVYCVYLMRQNKEEWKTLKLYCHYDGKCKLVHKYSLKYGEIYNFNTIEHFGNE